MCPLAQKPKKKPRHTSLVLPGEGKPAAPEKDRLGRVIASTHPQDAEQVDTSPRPAPPGTKPFDIETSEVPKEETPRPAAPPPTVEELLEAESGPQKPPARETQRPPANKGEAEPPKTAMGPKPDAEGFATQPGRKSKPAKTNRAAKPGAHTGRGPAHPAREATPEEDDLPENAIRMPRTGPRYTAVRQKKRRRRIGLAVVALLIVAAIALYISGFYLNIGMVLRDGADSLRIAFTPGDGYPAAFNLPGYITSESMGSRGFAALGEKDFVIYSPGGVELTSVQHGYTSPGISAGNTRVCLYNRGGREYTIEGRGSTIARRTADADILFAELSPSGWLALVTQSRYNVTLQLYNSVYDAEGELSWPFPIIDNIPVLATFHPDNRTVALGCLVAEGGGLDSVIHILRAGNSEVQATIEAKDARIVEAEYISSNRLLVVYDNHAALYSTDGAELARYDYAGRQLRSTSTGDGHTALILGSAARENLELVLLDENLAQLFTVNADSSGTPDVLASGAGVFLLVGQKVLAYSPQGALLGTHTLENRPQGLVYGGQSLALCSGLAEPLDDMLKPEKPDRTGATTDNSAATGGSSQPGGAPAPAP